MNDDYTIGIGRINAPETQDENAYQLTKQLLEQPKTKTTPSFSYELCGLTPNVPDRSWLLSSKERAPYQFSVTGSDLYDLIRQARQKFFEGYHAIQIFRQMPHGRIIYQIVRNTYGEVKESLYQAGPTRIVCGECGHNFEANEKTNICPVCQTNDHISPTSGIMITDYFPLDLREFDL